MKKPLLPAVVVMILLISYQSYSQVYPTDFSQVEVASGISSPTAMAFAPDGRIFVAQQNGVLLVIKNGIKLPTPAIQLPVNSSSERGLIGIALHPSFNTNGIIYLFYSVPDGSHNRVSRFWMTGDILNPASEQIIFELDPLGTSQNHNGGAMHFKGDKLYIATGENNTPANSQDLSNTHGKLLRINANGSIPGDNPFFSSTGTRQRNAIWAYGLRNPYTFDVQPGTDRVLINDVGQVTWEEVDDATVKGKNFGWPGSEGMTSIVGHTSPIYTYAHGSGDGVGCAITGGVFFNPSTTNYPAAYIGKYFFQDYCNGWINYLDVTSGAVRYSFATGLGVQTLALDVSPDGHLYFLTRPGKLNKILYTPGSGGNSPPVITDQPDNVFASIGQSAMFSVSATGTLPLSYQWKKNGQDILSAHASSYTIPAVQQSDAGQYTVMVYNNFGQVLSAQASLTINPNNLPFAEITSPASGTMYRAGDQIFFSGTATDPDDGILPASAFSWSVVFHHDTHVHDGPPVASGVKSGSFTIPTSGETSINVFYRLELEVTDSDGGTNMAYVDLKPNTSVMSLQSNPPGLGLTMDGQPVTSLASIKSVEGLQRTIGVVTPQTVNTVNYIFASWAHGGNTSQTIATPIDNTTYTANFSKVLSAPWQTTDIGKQNIFGNAALSNGTFTLSASGRDIYNNDDHFRFVYQTITGDCDIRARVTSMTNTNAWAKAGVMLRETLQPNSIHAMTVVTPSSGTSFQRRLTTGGLSSGNNASGVPPYWVRLVRSGNSFTSYVSTNGSTWTMIGSPVTVSMSGTIYAGLVVTSHNSNTLCTTTMTDVSVSPGAGGASVERNRVVLTKLYEDALQLFPNPVNGDVVTVRSTRKNLSGCRVQVLNSLGQVVIDKITDELSAGYDIDVRNFPPGFYFVKVDTKSRRINATFIRK